MPGRYYHTKKSGCYDTLSFSQNHKSLLSWMLAEYPQAISWTSFYMRIANGLITSLQKENTELSYWNKHPLMGIFLDLVGNVGIKNNELSGEISDMFLDHEKCPLDNKGLCDFC